MYFDLTISKCQKQVIESISFLGEGGGGGGYLLMKQYLGYIERPVAKKFCQHVCTHYCTLILMKIIK